MNPLMCPTWFQSINLIFDLIFFVVTALIAVTGYRAYLFFYEKKYRLHSLGFGLVALSYLVVAIINACLISGIGAPSMLGYQLFSLLYLAGIMLLLFVYLDIKQDSVRAILLILALAVVAVFNEPSIELMMHRGLIFYLLTAIMIGFIVSRLMLRYNTCRRTTTLLVLIGFGLLLIGQLLFGIVFLEKVLYPAAAAISLIGYGCISASRLMVKKNETTTKPRRSHS